MTGRVWRLPSGGLQLDACDADLRLRGPRRAGPHGLPPTRPGDPAARRDVDGARPGGGQPGDVLHEVHHLTAGDDGAAGRGAGTHQQPGRGGVLRLGLEHVPYVALAVADGDHPGSRAGPPDLLRQGQALQPAAALAATVGRLRLRRPVRFRLRPPRASAPAVGLHGDALPEAGVDGQHPEAAAGGRHRQRHVRRDADAARSAAAELRQTARGALQAGKVQHRGVLDGQDLRLGPAALERGHAVALDDVVHAHPGVGKQPVGRTLILFSGEDNGDRLTGPGLPGPPHGQDPAAHPSVGMAAQPELQVRPVGVLRDRRGRAQPARRLRPAAHAVAPVRIQRPHPDAAGLRSLPAVAGRMAGGGPGELPSGRRVGRARALRADIGEGHRRTDAVQPLPVIGKPPCRQPQNVAGQVRDLHAWQDQEPGVLHQQPQLRHPLPAAPADVGVPGPLVPVGRVKAEPADAPQAFAADPVEEESAGIGRVAPGMVALHHRPQGAPLLRRLRHLQPDTAELRERAGEVDVGMLRQRSAGSHRRSGLRQGDAVALRDLRQGQPGGGDARRSGGVGPVLALAQASRQTAPSGSRRRRGPQPPDRFLPEMAHPDLHANQVTRTTCGIN